MKHEKIIKRSDGSRIEINVDFYADYSGNSYKVSVYKCEAGKRKFFNVHDSDDYTWRRLNHEERQSFILNKQLEYVSQEEILQAKIELWEKLKPTI